VMMLLLLGGTGVGGGGPPLPLDGDIGDRSAEVGLGLRVLRVLRLNDDREDGVEGEGWDRPRSFYLRRRVCNEKRTSVK